MEKGVLVVTDRPAILGKWRPAVRSFDGLAPEALAAYETVVLAPHSEADDQLCEAAIEWKRSGILGGTRLMLGTYRGRHLWSPQNDMSVERWAVHARSECVVLTSEKLAFVPLCLGPSEADAQVIDEGYLFMGGRKWRDFDAGFAAMAASGLPSKVITDLAPEFSSPNVDVRKERIPKPEYMDVMRRARLVLVPLQQMPISHGHVEVVAAIVAGKPVLVTACCSCDDYIEHGVNGLLVADNSPEAWAQAITEGYERADELAAGARKLAPKYYAERYGDYLRAMVADAEGVRIDPAIEQTKPYAPRSSWEHLRQENYLRRLKAEHRDRIDKARSHLKEGLFAKAIAEVSECLDGPLSASATQIVQRAKEALARKS
jgi:hypothetical protein